MPAPRTCIDCGTIIPRGSRCTDCAAPIEQARQARQGYRAAYSSAEYRAAKVAVRRRSGHRCEHTEADERCPRYATEIHHTVPLSTASTVADAIALCRPELLLHVCHDHNPRGGR